MGGKGKELLNSESSSWRIALSVALLCVHPYAFLRTDH